MIFLNKAKPVVFLTLLTSICSYSGLAKAAEITDVIDTADKRWVGGRDDNTRYKDDPFDMTIGVNWRQHLKNSIISRERSQYYPTLFEEMSYKYSDMILDFDVNIGIYHDLALYVNIPLVIQQQHKYSFAKNVDTSKSSIFFGENNDKNMIPFNPTNDFTYKHGTGIGNMVFALKWSPLNDERDPSVATWTLSVGYEAPTGKLFDPKDVTSLSPKNINARKLEGLNVGDKAHRINFTVAMSKRMFLPKKYALDPNVSRRGFIDPYFMLYYSLPIAAGSAVAPSPDDKERNFGSSQYKPSHVGGFKTGLEIVAYENVIQGRKLAFDFGVYGNYISEGRGYTPLTDALAELTYYENYMQVGGHFNIVAHLAEYVALIAGVSLGHETAHFITLENAGIDGNGNGQVSDDDAEDFRNPYWNANMDQIGTRFRVEQGLDFSYNVSLQVTF